jgi:cysteine desulfurase/selenocysteine lyase
MGWYSVENAFGDNRFKSYELKSGAACISAGMPNFPSLYALRHSLRFLLECGVGNIYRELSDPVQQLRRGLAELDVEMLTPPESELASGIVSFAHANAEEIGAALEKAGVIVWAGDGRVRASLHVYNGIEDVERYLRALKSIQRAGRLSVKRPRS